MTQIYPINQMTPAQWQAVAAQIRAGAVAVFPTDTVYGLGCSAASEAAIERVYALKQRPAAMALQILAATVEQAQQWVQWDERAARLAQAFWPGGLTLILRPNAQGLSLSRGFAGLGVRVPAHTGLVRLLAQLPEPLASTSANLHGQPVCVQAAEVEATFAGQADIILTDGTLGAAASSVLDMTDVPVLLREGCISRAVLEEALKERIK